MLSVKNLCKKYPSFELKNVTFEVKKGFITGFIGANGAGKTTTLKTMLNLVSRDSGSVTAFGKELYLHEVDVKQDIGFMMGGADYYSRTRIKKIAKVYAYFYKNWSEKTYCEYLKKFGLDENKKVCELSSGMKVKFAIALALSHDAKLMIFDEPTSGLDPVARAELLDLFREIIEDGERSILFSTHITSDLDSCADYILFIREGEIIAYDIKDRLIASHRLVKGGLKELSETLKSNLIAYKETSYGFTGLLRTENLDFAKGMETEIPNLEDLMVFYSKEKRK